MPDGTRGGAIPTAPIIQDLMARWAARRHHAPVSLIVIHSHSHSDHTAADAQFQGAPGVQFIAPSPEAVQKAAGIAKWPTDLGSIDLGNRVLDIIPIPGHDVASIALYDRTTGNLLTGDSLYPGRLYVRDTQISTYAASADRLVEFARTHPIAHVLGTHIEEGAQPYFDYPKGSTYQPKEHALELGRGTIFELADGFRRMPAKPVTTVYPDFSIVVVQKNIPNGYQAGDGRALDNGVSANP
jgi:glyoxylase-like metal-dependent hydrolase (beta-lactamase superfamily II)